MKKIVNQIICLLLISTSISCSKEDKNEPKILSSKNQILSFELPVDGDYIAGEIDEETKVISFNTIGQDLTHLKPRISYSEKARVVPSENEFQDFSSQVSYTVYAENGTSEVYRIQANNRPLSSEKKILSFALTIDGENVEAEINQDAKEIYIDVGTEITGIDPTITVSDFATYELIDESPDFTKPVKYKVTAEDGSSVVYELQVNKPNIDYVRSWVEELLFYPGAEIIVSGKFLNITTNTNFFLENESGEKIFPEIVQKESYMNEMMRTEVYNTFIKIPYDAPTGVYKLVVELETYTLHYNGIDILADDVPRVSSSEKAEYHMNDTLVLHGTNLYPYIMIPDEGSHYLIAPIGNYTKIEVNEDGTELRFLLDYHYDQFFWPAENKHIYLMDENRRIGESIEVSFK